MNFIRQRKNNLYVLACSLVAIGIINLIWLSNICGYECDTEYLRSFLFFLRVRHK